MTTMKFRTVRDALLAVLAAGASGKYRVLGYQKQAEYANDLTGTNRMVQVRYSDGLFPRDSSSIDQYDHDMTFKIELTVAEPATADLSAIEDPESTPTELATAIAGIKNAESLADLSLDELFNHVCDVLLDNRNIDLLMSETLESRWLNEFHKGQVAYHGDLCILTGTALFTCSMPELFDGAESYVCEEININIESYVNETEKDPAKAGVIVEV